VRELREELGVEVEVGDRLGRGEAPSDGGRVDLDVYAGVITSGVPKPREHAELRWVSAADLLALEWAAADIPVLPVVRGLQLSDATSQRAPGPIGLLCADWSVAPERRAACEALPRRTGWVADAVRPPLGGLDLDALLRRAEALRDATGHPVLVGIDAALGLPLAFGRRMGAGSFPEALRLLADRGALDAEAASPAEWGIERPFFRVPPGQGALTRFEERAGGRGGMLRQIERVVGGKSAFVLSGIPGSVGSGSRALWRELARETPRPGSPRLWPFDGDLAGLLADGAVVLGEMYPRAAAADLDLGALRKGRSADRVAALRRLASSAWLRERRVELRGLEEAGRNEHGFDALLATLALVRRVAEERPLADLWVDPLFEGGILAAARPASARQR